jgi:DNA-directed RNA polymerase subunit L
LVFKALEVLHSGVGGVAAQVADTPSACVPLNDRSDFYELRMEGVGHTLGHLLQYHIYRTYVQPGKGLEFAGYSAPHPLENYIKLKLCFTTARSPVDVIEFVGLVCDEVCGALDAFARVWLQQVDISDVKVVQRFQAKGGRFGDTGSLGTSRTNRATGTQ